VLRDPLPWDRTLEIAETAEETGYEALFVPEISAREAFGTLARLAAATGRLGLGTGVVTMGSRSPVTMAMAAATLQELSGGRAVLGLGAGQPIGAARRGIIDGVREYVGLVRDGAAGRPVIPSDTFGSPSFQLTMSPQPVPIWLGALGDRMVRLAGEVADGALLNWCTPERVRRARDLVEEGAREAGRDPGEVTVAVYVRACLGVSDDVALAALREMTGLYASLPWYFKQMEAMGLGDLASAAAKALQEGRPADIPDELVRQLCVIGGRGDAVARFAEYRAAGADVVLCYPVAALDPFSSVLGTLMAAAPSPAVER